MRDYFATTTSTITTQQHSEVISDDELNVMRYVCGYVIRTLLRRYEKKPGKVSLQYVECLGELAVEEKEYDDNVLSYTRKWFDKVNRGGLYPLNDIVFSLFIEIEKMVRILLPKQVLKSECDKDLFKMTIHDQILKNEEIQFYWTLLSQNIVLPEDAEVLLAEIIKLWVTIRGYAIAASWMEVYKKKTSQKSTGLRKSLSGHS